MEVPKSWMQLSFAQAKEIAACGRARCTRHVLPAKPLAVLVAVRGEGLRTIVRRPTLHTVVLGFCMHASVCVGRKRSEWHPDASACISAPIVMAAATIRSMQCHALSSHFVLCSLYSVSFFSACEGPLSSGCVTLCTWTCEDFICGYGASACSDVEWG